MLLRSRFERREKRELFKGEEVLSCNIYAACQLMQAPVLASANSFKVQHTLVSCTVMYDDLNH
jgi:hypothetical protein